MRGAAVVRREWKRYTAIALVPLLIFGSVFAALRIPAIDDLTVAAADPLDYSRGAIDSLAGLREPFISDVLGQAISSRRPPVLASAPRSRAPLSSRSDAEVPPIVVSHPLTNDHFGRAYDVPSVPFTARTNTVKATREAEEPSRCARVGGKTVWYRYVSGASVGLIANTFGSDHAVSLGVFTGDTKADLKELACSTDPRGEAQVAFPASAATTYYFQIASVSGGDLVFNLNLQGVTTHLGSANEPVGPVFGGPSANGRYITTFNVSPKSDVRGDCVGMIVGAPPVSRVCKPQGYVLDRSTGKKTLVTVASDGTPANDMTVAGDVSDDGRYVVMQSFATNLVPDDTNTCGKFQIRGQCMDIFVHDRDADGDGVLDETHPGGMKNVRVSVASDGTQANNISAIAGMSRDGRLITFASEASNLVPDDTNGVYDVFVHDRDPDRNGVFDETGQRKTFRVSVSATGEEAREDPISRQQPFIEHGSYLVGWSSNIRYVMFRSPAPTLVPRGAKRVYHVFVRDIVAGTTTQVDVGHRGGANAGSRLPNGFRWTVSDDGRYALFNSDASNLVPGDTNLREDLFIRDLERGETERVTLSSSGAQAENEPPVTGQDTIWGGVVTVGSFLGFGVYTLSELNHMMTPDGRYVFFSSGATNLVPEDNNGNQRDIFVRDRWRGTTTLVSVSTSGEQGDAASNNPFASADGRVLCFASQANNLDEDQGTIPSLIYSGFMRIFPGSPGT